jgi:glycosyl transferase family 25
MPAGDAGSPYAALNAFFDRIFVITLRRATERHERLPERLRGLRYELLWGTDKADLDLAALEADGTYSDARARRATRYRKPMTLGQIGCSLSHRRIYEAAIENGWQRVLVFEDDVAPRAEALAGMAAALAELPPDWELVYLGYERGERARPRDRVKQATYLALATVGLHHWTPRQVLGLYPRPFSPHLRVAGKHHCTHAYGFTLSGARKLLAGQTPVAYPSDQLLLHLCMGGTLRAFVTDPKFFDQDSIAHRTSVYTGA